MTDMADGRTPAVRAVEKAGRLAAAAVALAIVTLSVVPPGLRPVAAPQAVEHAAIFLLLGLASGLAAPGRWRLQAAAAILFTAGVELIQVLAPGRHARWSDLAVDTLGALAGIALAALLLRLAGRPGPAGRPARRRQVSARD
ncbi:VanZ family protein [Rhodoplanes sp. TEM]|uniref:VanZ family protein n=1 Tax=Rhodoplanes tepidamans TaxID=200616 RepID=A0ABT5JCZ4_RHOTP|nr:MULTISPECIES: VanZ family protein [Rhodoplanes]MDC7787144.1 VanZ family protein [Rhodoplanes tepidamans]MDC7984292.1 VanZ family protein [Rhodoplanes sp. TEM]MDQ0356089.1 VanZ family protein [Rhodoplanes tepidamans]